MKRGLAMAVATTILFLGIFIPTSAAFQDQALQLKSRQQQSSGTPLFLDEPSCDFYQCAITYYPGDNATAHWTDAPSGNVILEMLSHYTNMSDQPVATVPGVTTNCNTEGSSTCGQFSWIIPSSWAGGNFTLQATSESDSSVQSYTDTILVFANPNNTASIAFSALDTYISGSSTINPSSTAAAPGPASSASTTASGTLTSASNPTSSASTKTKTSSSVSSSGGSSGGSSGSSTDAAGVLPTLHASLVLLPCTVALYFAYLV